MSQSPPPPLLPRVAAGESEALNACLERYAGPVWWLANRYLPRRADAEEAVQDVFLDLWRHAGRFDPSVAAEKTFVLTIARRRLIDRRRRLSARPEALGEPPEQPADQPAAVETLAIEDESARVRAELAQLPDGQREVIEMAVDRGMSQTEIAAKTGLPLGTVKSHARRGMRTLRDRLRSPTPSSAHSAAPASPSPRIRETL